MLVRQLFFSCWKWSQFVYYKVLNLSKRKFLTVFYWACVMYSLFARLYIFVLFWFVSVVCCLLLLLFYFSYFFLFTLNGQDCTGTINSLKSLQIYVGRYNELLFRWLFVVVVYFGKVASHVLILQNRWGSWVTKSYKVIVSQRLENWKIGIFCNIAKYLIRTVKPQNLYQIA